jgi:predicted nucleic acid-binding Zn ribbon protein
MIRKRIDSDERSPCLQCVKVNEDKEQCSENCSILNLWRAYNVTEDKQTKHMHGGVHTFGYLEDIFVSLEEEEKPQENSPD